MSDRIQFNIGGIEVRNTTRYESMLAACMEDYNDPTSFPKILYSLPELEEYLDDFMKSVDCDIRCDLVFGRRPYVQFYIFRNSKDDLVDCLGFAVDVTYRDLPKFDIPHLGDYILGMWNAYAKAFIEEGADGIS